jgi:hypothetical protein
MAAADDVQLTEVVRFCVLPSENVPVAVSCRLVLLAMDGFTGVIVSDVKVTITPRAVAPVTGPSAVFNVAEILELPWRWPSASPLELIAATVVLDELQVTRLVRSLVLPSLKVPTAVNC